MILRRLPFQTRYTAPLLVAIASSIPLACDDGDPACGDDMPDGWSCGEPLASTADTPNCDQGAEEPSVALDAATATLRVGGVIFRTGEDDVCAWAHPDGDTLEILLQPCEMHPNEDLLKGFCYHHVDVSLPDDVDDFVRIDVLTRYDFLGYTPPETPPVMEHGSVMP